MVVFFEMPGDGGIDCHLMAISIFQKILPDLEVDERVVGALFHHLH